MRTVRSLLRATQSPPLGSIMFPLIGSKLDERLFTEEPQMLLDDIDTLQGKFKIIKVEAYENGRINLLTTSCNSLRKIFYMYYQFFYVLLKCW